MPSLTSLPSTLDRGGLTFTIVPVWCLSCQHTRPWGGREPFTFFYRCGVFPDSTLDRGGSLYQPFTRFGVFPASTLDRVGGNRYHFPGAMSSLPARSTVCGGNGGATFTILSGAVSSLPARSTVGGIPLPFFRCGVSLPARSTAGGPTFTIFCSGKGRGTAMGWGKGKGERVG